MIKIAHNMVLKNIPYLFCPEKPGPSPRCGIFDGPCLSRIAGVRDRWLCLGVLCLKSQIPSTKLQIQNRFNAQGRCLRRVSDCFFVWDFEFRSRAAQALAPRVVIWNFNKSMNF